MTSFIFLFSRACLGLPPQNYMLLEHKLQKDFLSHMTCDSKIPALKKVAQVNGTSKKVTNGFLTHRDDAAYTM